MWRLIDKDDKGGYDYEDYLQQQEAKWEHNREAHQFYESKHYVKDMDDIHDGDGYLQIHGETHTEDGVLKPKFKQYLNSGHGLPMRYMLLDYYQNHTKKATSAAQATLGVDPLTAVTTLRTRPGSALC